LGFSYLFGYADYFIVHNRDVNSLGPSNKERYQEIYNAAKSFVLGCNTAAAYTQQRYLSV
jgi:hypothetical protein